MKYSKSFRNAILKKVLPPENRSVYSVAKEVGVAIVTINSWLANLKNGTLTVEQDSDDPVNERSMKEKLNLLLEHQKIPEESEGEWLRQKGLHSEHVNLFRQEITSLMTDKSDQKDKRIRELEKQNKQQQKELQHKESALAEVVAILTLKKKTGLEAKEYGRGRMMSRESKNEILDFVNFYCILGIVRLSVLCRHIGVSERTIQRWNRYGVQDKRKGAEKHVARKLTEEERDEIYLVTCSEDYKDMNPHEVYNSLLDKGIYLASESSFYRILRDHNAVIHRSETKEGSSRNKPDELKASKKNQVWMWDITWIKTSVQGLYYYAYVIEDLFDRSIVGWVIYENESDEHAKELFELVTKKENANPQFIHSDNGNAMKGITLVAFYFRLGIIPSLSRPRVSDDNPYIESFFKTLKYTCGYPKFFTSLEHARKWFADFIDWYNKKHMHSGLQYVTPFQKRNEEHHAIFAALNNVLSEAKQKKPERWGNRETKKYLAQIEEVLNPARKDVA